MTVLYKKKVKKNEINEAESSIARCCSSSLFIPSSCGAFCLVNQGGIISLSNRVPVSMYITHTKTSKNRHNFSRAQLCFSTMLLREFTRKDFANVRVSSSKQKVGNYSNDRQLYNQVSN